MNDSNSPSNSNRPTSSATVDHGPGNSTARTLRGDSELRTIKRYALFIVILMALAICYWAHEILIPIVLALLLSLLLSPVVTLLERTLRLPRTLGSLFSIAAVVALLCFGVARLSEPAQKWIAHAPQTARMIEHRLRSFREPILQAQAAGKKIEEITGTKQPKTVVSTESDWLSNLVTNAPRALGEFAAVLLLMFFFLSSGNGFLRRTVEVAPTLREKRVVVSIAREVQEEMSRYLAMLCLINLCLGIVVSIALALLHVPNALLWGAVAAISNFAPYIGAACTLFALTLVGFSTFDTLGHALAVPGVFLLLTSLEGQLITPTIIGRRLSLNPTVVFVWLLLWGWLWGVIGILLAGPMLACFRIICQHVRALRGVAILIGND